MAYRAPRPWRRRARGRHNRDIDPDAPAPPMPDVSTASTPQMTAAASIETAITTGSKLVETLGVCGASMFGGVVGLNIAEMYAAYPKKTMGVALGAAAAAGFMKSAWDSKNVTDTVDDEGANKLIKLIGFSPMTAARVGVLTALIYEYTHTADIHLQAAMASWLAGLSNYWTASDADVKGPTTDGDAPVVS